MGVDRKSFAGKTCIVECPCDDELVKPVGGNAVAKSPRLRECRLEEVDLCVELRIRLFFVILVPTAPAEGIVRGRVKPTLWMRSLRWLSSALSSQVKLDVVVWNPLLSSGTKCCCVSTPVESVSVRGRVSHLCDDCRDICAAKEGVPM